jgi:hypothetical protein
MRTIAIVVFFGIFCVWASNTDARKPHRDRTSHVLACAAVQGAPCQAKLKFRMIGGGVAVTYRRKW